MGNHWVNRDKTIEITDGSKWFALIRRWISNYLF